MINRLVNKIKATNAPIVVGLDPMLIALNSKGMHLAVASSKPRVFVERIL